MPAIDRRSFLKYSALTAMMPTALQACNSRSEPGQARKQNLNCLFDNQKDTWSAENRIADSALADLRQDLHAKTLAWLDEVSDPFCSTETLKQTSIGTTRSFLGKQNPKDCTPKRSPLSLLQEAGVASWRPALQAR